MTRVTHQIIANQVVFNLSNSVNRFMKMQQELSTGKRINKASDDPVGTTKDLGYRSRLAEITQYKANISMADIWLKSTEGSLSNITDAISTVYETAVAMSNDTYDDVAREAAANEVQSLFDQILDAGNSQLRGNYLFSGYRTRTQPFELNTTGVVYRGDDGRMDHKIDTGASVQVNMNGSDLLTKPFMVIGEEADLNPAILGSTVLSSLNQGNGVDLSTGQFVINDLNLGVNFTIDISAATTIQDVIDEINAQSGATNVSASLGPEGNNIHLEGTNSTNIALTTPLANLNLGNGVDMLSGQFKIMDDTGTYDVTVDLAGNTTVGDAINSINSQLTAAGINNVTASLNAAGTGIDINDTNGVPLNLHIEEVSQSSNTAANLGIMGNIDPILNGSDLNPIANYEITEVGAGSTTATDLGIVGEFNTTRIGDDLNPIVESTTLLSQLRNSLGTGQGEFKIRQGEMEVTIDLSDPGIVTVQNLLDAINNSVVNVTASINSGQTGIQIVNNDPTRTLVVVNGETGRTASDLSLAGSTDVLGNVMLLINALHNNNAQLTGELIGPLREALDALLNQRASSGAKSVRLETVLNRLGQSELNFTKLLSDVEDVDLTKAFTAVAMQENAYMAALNAASKIIQPSLLNFIR